MTITCFFEPWVGRDAPLVELWRRAWSNEGWTPRVLSVNDAIGHPRYAALTAAIYKLPSVNDWRFESLCYVRWCAYSMAGGGVVSDYDVLPRVPFQPRDFHGFTNGSLDIDCGFVAGTSANFDDFIEHIIAHVPSESHVSDMTIMKKNASMFASALPLVQSYQGPDWKNFPLTHFGNTIMHSQKAKLVESVLYPESHL